MDKLKKYFIYILLLVGFFILSNFLINVGLNSTYKKITRKEDNLSQVVIYQEEATFVNGRIKGIVSNTSTINDKYIKFDFYSERNVKLGSKYIEVDKTKGNMPIEIYFKLRDVSYYTIATVNEKDKSGEIDLIPKDLTKPEVLVGTAIAMLIFW
ncbi:MAG: hypothetical protein ACLURX_02840 [Clostridia bacterium]